MNERKERPILFSGPMVRAILDGRKTQTRRVIKHRENRWECSDDGATGRVWPYWPCYVYGEPEPVDMPCPYGKLGDRLWVREAHAIKPDSGHVVAYLEGGECGAWCGDGAGGRFWLHHGHILEAPGYPFGLEAITTLGLRSFGGKWRPSIHMPRWASRITLEITGVRVERLNEISESDAMAEGVECCSGWIGHAGEPRRIFCDLWKSINGPESWAANPWVWVIEFQKVEVAR